MIRLDHLYDIKLEYKISLKSKSISKKLENRDVSELSNEADCMNI